MKIDIKERIIKIQNGDIPEGYKNSNVGIIPEEWEIARLKNFAKKVKDKNSNKNVDTVFSNSAQYGIVVQTDFFEKQIANGDNTETYTIVAKDDFVYNPRISSFAPRGPININKTGKTGVVSPLYTVFRLDKMKDELPYLEYYFKSDMWHRYMHSVANYGVRSDRLNLSNGDFFNMPIPLSSKKERDKITTILSIQDKIIELKEKLLAEKKRQKKYLMQVLLNPDSPHFKRLPGFSEEWEVMSLSDCAQIIGGGTPDTTNKEYWKGDIQWYTPSEIKDKFITNSIRKISLKGLKNSSAKILPKGTLLLTSRASIGEVAIAQTECTTNQGFQSLVIKNGNNEFFYYYHFE